MRGIDGRSVNGYSFARSEGVVPAANALDGGGDLRLAPSPRYGPDGTGGDAGLGPAVLRLRRRPGGDQTV